MFSDDRMSESLDTPEGKMFEAKCLAVALNPLARRILLATEPLFAPRRTGGTVRRPLPVRASMMLARFAGDLQNF